MTFEPQMDLLQKMAMVGLRDLHEPSESLKQSQWFQDNSAVQLKQSPVKVCYACTYMCI